MISIICKGDAKIILSKGTTNIINNEDHYDSAIVTMNGKTLTIDGEGALVAFGGQEGAGVGGTCGEVTIEDPAKIKNE